MSTNRGSFLGARPLMVLLVALAAAAVAVPLAAAKARGWQVVVSSSASFNTNTARADIPRTELAGRPAGLSLIVDASGLADVSGTVVCQDGSATDSYDFIYTAQSGTHVLSIPQGSDLCSVTAGAEIRGGSVTLSLDRQ